MTRDSTHNETKKMAEQMKNNTGGATGGPDDAPDVAVDVAVGVPDAPGDTGHGVRVAATGGVRVAATGIMKEERALDATLAPETFDREARTVEVVFSTEAPVARYTWEDGMVDEVLSHDAGHADFTRMNTGAPVLDTHRAGSTAGVLGVVERAWIADRKGYAVIRFAKNEAGTNAMELVADGILRNVSVGYRVNVYEVRKEEGKRPQYRAVEWEAVELSMVPVPADRDAQVRAEGAQAAAVTGAKQTGNHAGKNGDIPAPPATIRNNDMTEKDTGVVQNPTPHAAPTVDAAEVAQRAMAQERTRVAEITATARKHGVSAETLEAAITDGTSERDFKLKVLADMEARQARINGASASGDETEQFVQRLANAVQVRAGRKVDDPSMGSDFVNMRFSQMCKEALRREGQPDTGTEDEILKRAMNTRTYQGAGTMPVALKQVVERVLLAAHEAAPLTWADFCATTTVSDFRETEMVARGFQGGLRAVGENGEITRSQVPDAQFETISVTRKADIIGFTYEMMVNDYLGMFLDAIADKGAAAAYDVEEAVYATLALNAGLGPTLRDGNPLFHNRGAGRNNIGTGSALTVAGVNADLRGNAGLGYQKDLNGKRFISMNGLRIIVPLSLLKTAELINNAALDPTTGATIAVHIDNIARGSFERVIGTSQLAGNTTRRYYLNPMYRNLVVARLAGFAAPRTETRTGFKVSGMDFKIEDVWGVGVGQFIGCWTNAGA